MGSQLSGVGGYTRVTRGYKAGTARGMPRMMRGYTLGWVDTHGGVGQGRQVAPRLGLDPGWEDTGGGLVQRPALSPPTSALGYTQEATWRGYINTPWLMKKAVEKTQWGPPRKGVTGVGKHCLPYGFQCWEKSDGVPPERCIPRGRGFKHRVAYGFLAG